MITRITLIIFKIYPRDISLIAMSPINTEQDILKVKDYLFKLFLIY